MRYGPSLLERFGYWREKTWHCTIRRRHHVKMDSHPHCYRCGRKP